MRIWFDTEFYENGTIIELISIGAVCEDGSEFYKEVEGIDFSGDDKDWLRENVQPYLTGDTTRHDFLGNEFYEWVTSRTGIPEFWAYYADYDWVVLCQLYGRMIDLPPKFPKYCLDLKQEMYRRDVTSKQIPFMPTIAHNALDDARWAKSAHEWLDSIKDERT